MDQLCSAEKSSIDSIGLDVPSFEKLKQFTHEDEQPKEQDLSSKGELHDKESVEKHAVVGDACCQQDSTCDSVYNAEDTHTGQNNNCGNVETESNKEEPLDCTADISHAEPAKYEPLDYTLDVDSETGYKTYLSNESLYKPEENLQRKGISSNAHLYLAIYASEC